MVFQQPSRCISTIPLLVECWFDSSSRFRPTPPSLKRPGPFPCLPISLPANRELHPTLHLLATHISKGAGSPFRRDLLQLLKDFPQTVSSLTAAMDPQNAAANGTLGQTNPDEARIKDAMQRLKLLHVKVYLLSHVALPRHTPLTKTIANSVPPEPQLEGRHHQGPRTLVPATSQS